MKKTTLILKLICLTFAAATLFSLTGCFSLPDDYDEYNYHDFLDEEDKEDDDEKNDEEAENEDNEEKDDDEEKPDDDVDENDEGNVENMNSDDEVTPQHNEYNNVYNYEYNNDYHYENNNNDEFDFAYNNNDDTHNNTLNNNINNNNSNTNSSNNNSQNQDNSSDSISSENCNNSTQNSADYDYYYNRNVMPEVTRKTKVPDGYIGIYTVDDLKNADLKINKKYILMNNLNLSGINDWEGITNKSTFDGNGYTISNLSSTSSGLFKYANDVTNLYLTNVNIVCKIKNDDNKLGAICNRSGGTVSGCYVSGTIKYQVNKSINKPTYVGGITGQGYRLSFCKNEADITVESYRENNTFAGGISGYAYYINDCINYGKIKLEATTKDGISTITSTPDMNGNIGAGGICGRCDTKIQIDACRNDGEVSSNVTASGIIAIASSVTEMVIKNCFNTGRILAYGHSDCTWVCAAGGIVGRANAYFMHNNNVIENCYNSSEIGIDRAYNADFNSAYIGAIIGYEGSENSIENDIIVKNCTICETYPESGNRATPSGVDAVYDLIISLTDGEMHNISNYNFTNKSAWRNSPSTTSPYPFCIHNYF